MTTEKTVEALQEEHTDMLATAYDIGLEVSDELKANFTDAGAGAGIVSALDALIREHQSKEVLANDGEGEHTGEVEASSEVQETAPPKKPRKKPKKATAKKAEASSSGETEVAIVKEATVRKAKAAPAKKATKKAPGKKASASARTKVGTPRVKYEDSQKLVKLGENPSDPKSGRGQRIANVLKHNGKTYKTYRASGGKDGTLNWCIKAGLVKVA